MAPQARPVVLVTGVGRRVGIGAAIAHRLAVDGWDVATSWWAAYDDPMPWGHQSDDVAHIAAGLRAAGAATVAVGADLEQTDVPARCSTPTAACTPELALEAPDFYLGHPVTPAPRGKPQVSGVCPPGRW